MSETIVNPTQGRTAQPLVTGLRLYVTIALPFLLALISVRVVMSPLFLQVEYNRAGFPEDYYGFTQQDRLTYAPYALDYLLNGENIDFLGDLQFPDGSSMYNVRELHHMRDVKTVTQYAFGLAILGSILYVIAAIYLYRMQPRLLRNSLFSGALLTLGIIAAIVIIAVVNWDFFFTGFHTLFFASGTWRFEYSDTLIRLFPEQFWFDAALVIGGLTCIGALIILSCTFYWARLSS
jgi:integral membrane protein (TIGR01906 family)